MNIIWQKPDGGIAVTSILNGDDPSIHALALKQQGDIPVDWTVAATNYSGRFPAEKQEAWIWSGAEIISDLSRLAVVPERIEALNGLLVLDQAGLSAAYTAWANAPERTFAQRAFINKAMTWRRDDPTLNAAATDLGLSSAQVDALFIQAAT